MSVARWARLAPLGVCFLAMASVPGAQAASLGGDHPDFWNFTAGADGASPEGDLLLDAADNVYGTTTVGGISANGTAFMATYNPASPSSGSLVTLHDFQGGADGSLPAAGLVADSSGALYGTTALDGAQGGGTVFQLIPPAAGQTAWTETTLWSFGGAGDGRTPVGTLAVDANGVLIGTTSWGGAFGKGAVFTLHPPKAGQTGWTENIAWSFTGGADGANPVSAISIGVNGRFFGTTKAGGTAGAGTIFELVLTHGTWTETTVWGFTGGADGASPTGPLLADGAGGYYGTTQYGGVVNANCNQARFPYYGEPNSESAYAANAAYIPPGGNGCGVVFHLTPPAPGAGTWSQAVIWQFTAGLDGANPAAGLALGSNGSLYGMTPQYGETFWGTAYSLSPPAGGAGAWTMTPQAAFNDKHAGFYPRGTPIFGLRGRIYGTASFGGTYWTHVKNYGYGTIFSIEQ